MPVGALFLLSTLLPEASANTLPVDEDVLDWLTSETISPRSVTLNPLPSRDLSDVRRKYRILRAHRFIARTRASVEGSLFRAWVRISLHPSARWLRQVGIARFIRTRVRFRAASIRTNKWLDSEARCRMRRDVWRITSAVPATGT